MASFDGHEFRMPDGSCVKTKAIDVVSSTDISPYLSCILEDSFRGGNRAVIFRLYWDVEFFDRDSGKKIKWCLSGVTLSTRNLCLFLELSDPFLDSLKDLYRFFASKLLTFVGVRIGDDLTLLKETHGAVIHNVVEIGKSAAKIREKPVLEFLCAIGLAQRILGWYDLSRLALIQYKWDVTDPNERLEAAASEGWLVCCVWDRLIL
ncbi:PREDICTED: uncharacterized protein At5g06450-like [Tarenaya hassleriana]|uniref:uncharacterized protein At5g06450-like n=1 Tax=Tarenaya hassleriana TaxID=28532 RepID=UPI00053C661F|nr:PREDICTED: uncharacterized protein At5g06450-like [Tarenaya hassleriana]XP_010543853.1 PREDICTED: uncharacterized protein At5g06450-like [Tarenaya hassleriana]